MNLFTGSNLQNELFFFKGAMQISTCLFSFSSGFFCFFFFSGDLTVRKMHALVMWTIAWLLINAKWDEVINPKPQFLYL